MVQMTRNKGSKAIKKTGLRSKLQHYKSINRQYRKDIVAVSEAIGTILLLAIAMTVVGTIGVWVYTLDQPEETTNINLDSGYETDIITIEHLGGETLKGKETQISIVLNEVTFQNYKFQDSENNDLADGKWSIGDVWVKNISNITTGLTDPTIEVLVRHTRTGETFLFKVVRMGQIGGLADVAVTAQDIEFHFEGDSLIIKGWLNVTATIWNIGNTPVKNVIVRFFDDDNLLILNGSQYQVIDISNLPGSNYQKTWVNFTTTYWGKQTITVKVYSSSNEINYRNNYAQKDIYVEPTAPVVHGPDLEISSYDILFSNDNPIHGDSIQITTLVHNTGDEDVQVGKAVKVHIYDDKGALNRTYTFYSGLSAGTYHPCDFGIWDARPGGISVMRAGADITFQVNETDEGNNNASRPLQIMPTIIVVDDDNANAGILDVFEEMAGNLDASGVDYKWTKTNDDTGLPSYEGGQYPLKDFDIIIWMTGYDKTDTLTAENIVALNQSLVNGSYLWLIGQDVLSDITTKFDDKDGDPDPGEFAYDYLGVDQYSTEGTPYMLYGHYDDPITNGTEINTSEIFENQDRGVKLKPKTLGPSEPDDDIAGILENNTLLGVGWNNSMRYYNHSMGFKVVYFGWEYSGIDDIIDRVNITYHVLKWFNWSISIGKDFAVSSEEFSTATPKFMDKLTISATIRNNGPLPGDNVRVMFYYTGNDGNEKQIPKYPDNKENPQTIYIPGDGGELTVSKQWLAVSVGLHNFRVMVDPYNEYEEVSEDNNDVEYSELIVTQLFIQYNVLVVDDDNSTNNDLAGSGYNVTENITNALDFLKYPYDVHVIPGGFAPQSGPNVTIMKYYNTIIWLTGDEFNNTLMQYDQDNLTDYLEGNYYEAQFLEDTRVNLWLIGQDILDDLETPGLSMTPQNDFVKDILKVSLYSTGSGLPTELDGVTNDLITHGIEYPINSNAFLDTGDDISPNLAEGATGIFWQNAGHTRYNSIKGNATRYNVVFNSWEFSFIDNPSDYDGGGMFAYNVWDTPGLETNMAELVYLNLHWLGYPETRIELKTSKIDIRLSNKNPMLGDAYVINSEVYNYGTNETSVVVRFFDGDTIIDTKTVYVPVDGKSSLEVIWIPLFAGQRDIKIAIDPANDVPEVFEVLNNNASLKNQHVYFFFDDLEDGIGDWRHDNTIVRINGESPIPFMGEEDVYTNIQDSWNMTLSGKFAETIEASHSYNSSYYTMEPEFPVKPIDIVMVLDNTENMTITEIQNLQTAVNNFISDLNDHDRVALYTYDSNSNPAPYDPFTGTGDPLLLTALPSMEDDNGFIQMDEDYTCPVHSTSESGRQVSSHLVNLIDNTGGVGRQLWNITHTAIDKANFDSNSSHVPVVVVMSRGDNATSTWQYQQGKGPQNNTNGYDDGVYWPESPNNPNDDWLANPLNDEVCKAPERVWTIGLNFTGGENSTIGNKLNETAQSSQGKYHYTSSGTLLTQVYKSVRAQILSYAMSEGPGYRGSERGPRGLFGDDFEIDLSQWDDNGITNWYLAGDAKYSGAQSAKSDGAGPNMGDLTSDDIDLSKTDAVTLSFYYKLKKTEGTDLNVYLYDGTSYNLILQLADGTENAWLSITYPFSPLEVLQYSVSNFRIRITSVLESDESVWVDLVSLSWTEPAPPPPPPPPPPPEDGGGFIGNVTEPGDRNLTTETFSLENVTSATLSFYHKYNLQSGLNGVVVQVGTFNGTNWNFEYIIPNTLYPGNYNTSDPRDDDYGQDMLWCYNGISGNGRYTWDYVEVDLDNWTGQANIRVRFLFMWSYWGNDGKYYVDDVVVKVMRDDDEKLTATNLDQWELTDTDSHSGTHSWWNHNPDTGNLSGNLDNSLYSRPIDLTNARNATLSAYFKFNINASAGNPPDGFRVEVSDDNGVTWKTITLGIRAAWGVSGNESDIQDGVSDGKSYTGLDPDGDRWVEAGTLTRLNCDISGWTGNVIMIRFRVVTASDDNPYFFGNHLEWYGPGAAFGGFYIDDITVTGASLLE